MSSPMPIMGTPKSVGLVWDLPEESEVQVGCVADFVSGTGSKQAIIRVTCSDRSGLLADLTGHLMYNRFDIMSANVTTDTESGLIVDTFHIRYADEEKPLANSSLRNLEVSMMSVAEGTMPYKMPIEMLRGSRSSNSFDGDSIRRTASVAKLRSVQGESVDEKRLSSTPRTFSASFGSDGNIGEDNPDEVELSNEQDDDFTMLRVEVPDRPGLLTDLVKSLKVNNVSVVAASIQTHGATAVDVFKLRDGTTNSKLSVEKFEALRRGVQHRARRIGISQSLGSSPALDLSAGDPPATPADFALLDESCGALPAFESLLSADRREIFHFFRRRTFPKGTPVLVPGAEMFVIHVVESGTITCFERDRRLRRADRLGELGTIQSSLCEVRWVAEEEATCWVIDRRQLNVALHGAAARRRQRATQALSDLPMMRGLTLQQLLRLIDVSRREEAPSVRPHGAALPFLEVVLDGCAFAADPRAAARSPHAAQRVAEEGGPFFATGLSTTSADAAAAAATSPRALFCLQAGDAYGEAVRIARSADPPGALGSVPDPSVSARPAGPGQQQAACVLLCVDREVFERVLGSPEQLLRSPGPLASMEAVRDHEALVAAAAAASAAAQGLQPPPQGMEAVGGSGHSQSPPAKVPRAGSHAGADDPLGGLAAAVAAERPMPVFTLPPLPSAPAQQSAPAAAPPAPAQQHQQQTQSFHRSSSIVDLGSIPAAAAAAQRDPSPQESRFRNPNQQVTWHGSSDAYSLLGESRVAGGNAAGALLLMQQKEQLRALAAQVPGAAPAAAAPPPPAALAPAAAHHPAAAAAAALAGAAAGPHPPAHPHLHPLAHLPQPLAQGVHGVQQFLQHNASSVGAHVHGAAAAMGHFFEGVSHGIGHGGPIHLFAHPPSLPQARSLDPSAPPFALPGASAAPGAPGAPGAPLAPSGKHRRRGAWNMELALADFVLGQKLGDGLTARVHYARLKVRGMECALKIMRKAKLLELGEEHHVLSEVEALDRVRSPFVTGLLGSFQDSKALYLAVEYLRGPDLFAYMHELNTGDRGKHYVPLPAVVFYSAQVLMGLDALHSEGYVYRDLKPENILMDGHGNLKVADLGFAKLVFSGGRAYTVCGTPDYLAPEVIEHRGASRGSDYWALGILIYEFLCGFPPFQGEPKWYQFKKICAGRIEYWPDGFPDDARDLVQNLLMKDESRRLGLMAGGIDDIRRHRFYAGVDWDALLRRALPPPFTPDPACFAAATANLSDGRAFKQELAQLLAGDAEVSPQQQALFASF